MYSCCIWNNIPSPIHRGKRKLSLWASKQKKTLNAIKSYSLPLFQLLNIQPSLAFQYYLAFLPKSFYMYMHCLSVIIVSHWLLHYKQVFLFCFLKFKICFCIKLQEDLHINYFHHATSLLHYIQYIQWLISKYEQVEEDNTIMRK